MRILFCLWLLSGAVFAEDLPLLGLAHVGFRVSDLEKARAFYHGILGYDEAFDLIKPPLFGADNRWQLNLYDPDGSRVECMSPKENKGN